MAEVKLDSLLFPRFYLFVILLMLTACSSIKIVTVKNNTNESIAFQGHFIAKSNNTSNLEFILRPGEINSWRYEIGAFEDNILDKGLIKIILSDPKGCVVALDRNAFEDIAIKNGMWVINIDKNVMKCKENNTYQGK